jgi:alkylation response protein AidB-like acyl-CoA dehydrogenase
VTKTARWTADELAAFQAGLTPESLSAVMRSTWTWDDRALRRDLARLLTGLTVVRELDAGDDIHRLVRGRTLQAAAVFLAAVLGPRVIADAGQVTSFSHALVRSPGLAGGPEDRVLVHALGAETVETMTACTTFDLASSREFASRALAAHALSASRDQEAGAQYHAKIEAGALSATLAAAEASGSWDPALVGTRASLRGPRWTLDGEKFFVPHADTADMLFVIARSTAGPSLFAVEKAAPGVMVSPMTVIDPTRPLARLQLHQVPATLIGVEGAGGRLMARVLDLATVSLAEAQVTGARRCLELSVAAARAAVPDARATDLVGELRLRLEVARVMWAHARRVVTSETEDAGVAAAMAHICCSESFTQIARATVQLVDGEPDGADIPQAPGPSVGAKSPGPAIAEAERLFRRAQSSELLFGGPAVYYERLLERMGI